MGVFLEVFGKARCQHFSGLIVFRLIGPCILGIEYFGGYVGALCGHIYVEDGVKLKFYVVQSAGKGSSYHGTGIFKAHALAYAVASARPAGIDKIYIRVALSNLFAQHFSVNARIQGKEGSAEAGGEGSLGLGNSALGAGQL